MTAQDFKKAFMTDIGFRLSWMVDNNLQGFNEALVRAGIIERFVDADVMHKILCDNMKFRPELVKEIMRQVPINNNPGNATADGIPLIQELLAKAQQ